MCELVNCVMSCRTHSSPNDSSPDPYRTSLKVLHPWTTEAAVSPEAISWPPPEGWRSWPGCLSACSGWTQGRWGAGSWQASPRGWCFGTTACGSKGSTVSTSWVNLWDLVVSDGEQQHLDSRRIPSCSAGWGWRPCGSQTSGSCARTHCIEPRQGNHPGEKPLHFSLSLLRSSTIRVGIYWQKGWVWPLLDFSLGFSTQFLSKWHLGKMCVTPRQ